MENQPQGDLLRPTPASPAPFAPLEAQLDLLYKVLFVAFAAVIVTNVAVTGVFIWQTKLVRQELDRNRRALAQYQRVQEPMVKDLISKLESYGLQNRDFQPLLQKYPVLFPRFADAGSAAPSKTPAPAPASVPAKAPPAASPKGPGK